MKSILWKEYLEHRYHFLILSAFGICALLVLNHYNSLDSGTVVFVLFVFSCPAFALLIGMHMIAIENMRNTFPFLAMLPISRSKLWWAKTVFSLLFCGSIYLVYIILSLIADAGVLGFNTFNFYHANLPKFPFGFIFASLPAVFLSLGLFVTMLPNIPGMIVLGIFSAFLLTLLFSQGIFFYNVHLICFLLAISFLVSSRLAFLHGEMLDSLKRSFWGLGTLSICLLVSALVWNGLDTLSNKIYQVSKWGSFSNHVLVENETSVIFAVPSSPTWWDPVQEHGIRSLRLDTRTGKIEGIGNRMMYSPAISPDKRYLAAYHVYPSLRLWQKYGVVLIDLFDNERIIRVDDNGRPLGFTKKGDFVYLRISAGEGNSRVTELCYHQIGSGTRVIEARPSDNYAGIYLMQNQDSILYNIRNPDARTFILNLNDFSVKRLEVPSSVLPIGNIGGSTLLFSRDPPSARPSYFILDELCGLTPANWVPLSMKFIGNTGDGRGLGLVSGAAPPSSPIGQTTYLVILDGINQTASNVTNLDDLAMWNDFHEVDGSGQFLVTQFASDKPNVLSKVRIEDGSIEKFECPFSYPRGIVSIGPGRFLLRVNEEIWSLDLRTKEFRKLTGI